MMRKFTVALLGIAAMGALLVSGVQAQDAFNESKNREISYGLGYMKAGDYDMAELRFRLATGERVDKAKAYFLLGIAHLAQREFPQAREALAEAYRLDPALEGQLEQAWADLEIDMDIPVEPAARQRAPAQYESSPVADGAAVRSARTPARRWTGLVYNPVSPPDGTAEADLADGKDALRNNMPAMAEEYLTRALKKDPSLAEAHFWLAGAQRKLEKPAAARTALAAAYRLDPGLRAHEGELARFGSDKGGASPSAQAGGSSSCDDLYGTCMVTATRCGMNGCTTDFGRQASCTSERNMCYRRNRR